MVHSLFSAGLALAIMVLGGTAARAQTEHPQPPLPITVWPADYVPLSSDTGGVPSYLQLSRASNPNGLDGDLGQAWGVPLPFPFRFLGSGPFTRINVGAKGYVTLGESATDQTVTRGAAEYLFRSSAPKNVIAAWWGDHFCDPVHGILAMVRGDAPHREFIIEWSRCSMRSGSGGSETTFEAQVSLLEGSDVIRVRYGEVRGPGGPGWEGLSWGLKGAVGSGAMGPDRSGELNQCYPRQGEGEVPACTLDDFPAEVVIQYGRSPDGDLTGRPGQSTVAVHQTELEVKADLTLLNAGASQLDQAGFEFYLAAPNAGTVDAPGNIKVHSHPHLERLAAGETKRIASEFAFTKPPTGTYRLCAALAVSGPDRERDQSNNWVCFQDSIGIGPDLVGEIQSPAFGEPGGRVQVPVRIRNVGNALASGFDYRIILSPADIGSAEPPRTIFSDSIAGLAEGVELALPLEVDLPAIIREETYFMSLELDFYQELDEANRANNLAVSPSPMVNRRPKLAISPGPSVTLPDGCYFGEPVVAEFEVCNSGDAIALNFRPGVILGDGGLFNLDEDPIAAASPAFCGSSVAQSCEAEGETEVSCGSNFCRPACTFDAECGSGRTCREDRVLEALNGLPGARSCQNLLLPLGATKRSERCQTYSVQGRIPTHDGYGRPLVAGVKRLFVVSDVLHTLSQPYPDVVGTNEFACRPALIDLAVVEMGPDAPLVAGKSAPVTMEVENLGFGGSHPTTFRYRYVLSATRDISTYQIPLQIPATGGAGVATIDRRGSVRRTDLVHLPADLVPGEYYLGLILDPDDEHRELDKRNNAYAHPNPIVVGPRGLQIDTSRLPRAVVGSLYTHSLLASLGTGSYVWTASALPAGLVLSESGVLSGIPSDAGNFAFVVSVEAAGFTAERVLALEILAPQSRLEIVTHHLPIAIKNVPYGRRFDPASQRMEEGVQLVASGGRPPYRWMLDPELPDNWLPEGFGDPSEDGWIRGQPSPMSTSRSFGVVVVDSLGSRARASLEIVVVGGADLAIRDRTFPLASSGDPFRGCVVALGGDGTFRWELDADSLPPGLESEQAGAELCLMGVPRACGSYALALRVADSLGQRASQTVGLDVDCGIIRLESSSPRPVRRGETLSLQLIAYPSNSPSFSMYGGRLPEGLTLHEDGLISGTVNADAPFGAYDAVIELRDDQGRRSLNPFAMRVRTEPSEPKAQTTRRTGCSTAGPGALPSFATVLLGAVALCRRRPNGPRSRKVVLTCLVALLGAGAAACSQDQVITTLARCTEVPCQEDFTCDENDGQCKCGGAQGIPCGPAERCSLEPQPNCVTDLCTFSQCGQGQSCDPTTGECHCGTDVCADDEWCLDHVCVERSPCDGVSCTDGSSCDPEDGLCKCGGQACPETEVCIDARCSFSRCIGVSCGPNEFCDEHDGSCHCGSLDGPLCGTGESCVGDGETATCESTELCDDVVCDGGTVCDPADGLCRCGGIGADHPICDPEQTCIAGECRGGLLCEPSGIPKSCAPGLACDPSDGFCKCGGKGGDICIDGDLCTTLEGAPRCTSACALLANPSDCPAGEACFFDGLQAHRSGFCAVSGGESLGGPCSSPVECGPGLNCGPDGRCLKVCSTSDAPTYCRSVGDDLVCIPFEADTPYGTCQPL